MEFTKFKKIALCSVVGLSLMAGVGLMHSNSNTIETANSAKELPTATLVSSVETYKGVTTVYRNDSLESESVEKEPLSAKLVSAKESFKSVMNEIRNNAKSPSVQSIKPNL